ncbi:hypothetical protein M3Y97_00889400 [Aphelenchoides bicaudatus]|nr:hypothetical protein M3Y97_00889400 [Aphelenchoides bicaudatus]
MRHVDGSFALKNAQTQHFLCLNRRLRFTTMATGTSLKCRFYEHMDQSGYTLIESAWSPGTLLGFGKNGHSINTKTRARKRRCFFFSKLESSVNLQQTNDCTAASRQSKSTRESHRYIVDPTFLNDVFQKSLNRVFA